MTEPTARTIHAPAPYRDVLLDIYASLGVTVSAAAPTAACAPRSRTGVNLPGATSPSMKPVRRQPIQPSMT